jgi:hypothetical protein
MRWVACASGVKFRCDPAKGLSVFFVPVPAIEILERGAWLAPKFASTLQDNLVEAAELVEDDEAGRLEQTSRLDPHLGIF